jgi:hypothetical protein
LSNDGFLRLKRISSELFGVKKGLQDSGEASLFFFLGAGAALKKYVPKRPHFHAKQSIES